MKNNFVPACNVPIKRGRSVTMQPRSPYSVKLVHLCLCVCGVYFSTFDFPVIPLHPDHLHPPPSIILHLCRTIRPKARSIFATTTITTPTVVKCKSCRRQISYPSSQPPTPPKRRPISPRQLAPSTKSRGRTQRGEEWGRHRRPVGNTSAKPKRSRAGGPFSFRTCTVAGMNGAV